MLITQDLPIFSYDVVEFKELYVLIIGKIMIKFVSPAAEGEILVAKFFIFLRADSEFSAPYVLGIFGHCRQNYVPGPRVSTFAVYLHPEAI